MSRKQLEALSRDELIAKAQSLTVARATRLTRNELIDAIASRQASGEPKKPKGLVGKLRDMFSAVFDRGRSTPQDSEKIRNPSPPPAATPAPVATVTLAEIYAAQGHIEKALGVIDAVLVREPGHPTARAYRARFAAQPHDAAPVIPSDSDSDDEQLASPAEPVWGGILGNLDPSSGLVALRVPAPTAERPNADILSVIEPEGQPLSAETTSAQKPAPMLDELPLPSAYDLDEIVAMPVDPTTTYVYWEARAATIARHRTQSSSGRLWVRLDASSGGERACVKEFEAYALVGDYFVHGVPQGATLHTVLGWQDGDVFEPITHAAEIQSPRSMAAASTASEVVSWSPRGHSRAKTPPGIALATALADAAAGVLPPLPEGSTYAAMPESSAAMSDAVTTTTADAVDPRPLRFRQPAGSSEQWAEAWDAAPGASSKHAASALDGPGRLGAGTSLRFGGASERFGGASEHFSGASEQLQRRLLRSLVSWLAGRQPIATSAAKSAAPSQLKRARRVRGFVRRERVTQPPAGTHDRSFVHSPITRSLSPRDPTRAERLSLALIMLLVLLLPQRAQAEPPSEDDDDPDIIEQRSEAEALPRGSSTAVRAPVRLSVVGWRHARSDGRLDTGAGAVIALPLDKLSRPERPAPQRASRTEIAATPEGERDEPVRLERHAAEGVTPAALKQLVRAALRVAKLGDDRRLANLSTRARGSGAMPELRLRVVRSSDASARLTSTETDAVRTQASGGASMLYEARATWRLDRIVFSDDELAIERIRLERAEQRRKVLRDLNEAIAAWLKATERAADGLRSAEDRSEALTRQLAASITLDTMTDGLWSELRSQ